MKTIAIILILVFSLSIVACGNTKVIDGVEYDTYGIFNSSEKRNPKIHYEVSFVNLLLAGIFIETIVIPIYIVGFDLFEPICPEADIKVKGEVAPH